MMPAETPGDSVTVDEELLKEIDDYRFCNRKATSNQATPDLIRLGLKKPNSSDK